MAATLHYLLAMCLQYSALIAQHCHSPPLRFVGGEFDVHVTPPAPNSMPLGNVSVIITPLVVSVNVSLMV
jgi:hypothetical protein